MNRLPQCLCHLDVHNNRASEEKKSVCIHILGVGPQIIQIHPLHFHSLHEKYAFSFKSVVRSENTSI